VVNAKTIDKHTAPEATIDPLNPHRLQIALDEGGSTVDFSIAAMPRAQEPEWVFKRPEVPAGKVERHTLKSAILGNERIIWVYTPPGYKAKNVKSYALIVLLDGFAYQNWMSVPTVLDNLVHAGKLPPTVAVLVGNAPQARMSELEYNPAFVQFVSKELLPWVHQHWTVTSDPKVTTIGGYSAGGAAAAFLAMTRSDIFGNVISQSGDFQEGHQDVASEWLAIKTVPSSRSGSTLKPVVWKMCPRAVRRCSAPIGISFRC
jgi:enterochelin esterase family protein